MHKKKGSVKENLTGFQPAKYCKERLKLMETL